MFRIGLWYLYVIEKKPHFVTSFENVTSLGAGEATKE